MVESHDEAPATRGHRHHGPPVVGIFASAGGIRALKEFFSSVRPESGAAYVVMLHLSPDHDSQLAEVLRTTAPMPVTRVHGTAALEPNHVYVVPPNKSLDVAGSTLHITDLTRLEQRRAPVDFVFWGLAETHGSRSICVILSGTGPNGSSGLKRVKEDGGLVLVQDPNEAEYGDMPRNAIATGLVDAVLPVSQMPARITAYLERLRRDESDSSRPAPLSEDSASEIKRQAAEALQRTPIGLEERVRMRTAQLETEAREHEAAKSRITNLLHRLLDAQEEERTRIARDLHDDLGQQLTALRLALERHQQLHGPETAELAEALSLTERVGRDLDSLAWQLRPSSLDELGLAAALPRFIREWSEHVGIPAELRVEGFEPGHLTNRAEVTFYRVAQEALSNVAKHAHPTRVDVVLASSHEHVVLVIEDDGIGFDPNEQALGISGFGLAGMRERAGLIGARLEVESTPGKGTAVYLRALSGSRAPE